VPHSPEREQWDKSLDRETDSRKKSETIVDRLTKEIYNNIFIDLVTIA